MNNVKKELKTKKCASFGGSSYIYFKKNKSGLQFVPYIDRFPFTFISNRQTHFQALPCMKTLPTYSFLFLTFLLLVTACVPEQQAMDLANNAYSSSAMFVSNKPSEGFSAFYDQKSQRIIGFIAASAVPVKIRVYDVDKRLIFGENLSDVGKKHDFTIDFAKNDPGIYQVRIELENGDIIEEWLSVDI